MKFLKTKKAFAIILFLCFTLLYFRHLNSEKQAFYQVDYPKQDISSILKKETLTDSDYETVFEQTGVSPEGARDMIQSGQTDLLNILNDMYFEKPDIEKTFIAYPVTAAERNKDQITPIVDLKNGDVLVTFNTHTLDWRHGHCSIVVDADRGIMLEHMSIGNTSCLTYAENWGKFPAFVVLRYPDEKIAQEACEYAKEHLVGIDYNILAGVIKKDKSDEEFPESSHCSHIVWQAYKAVGIDIDETGGIFVTPENIAMSNKMNVVQIYGLDPKDYSGRLAK